MIFSFILVLNIERSSCPISKIIFIYKRHKENIDLWIILIQSKLLSYLLKMYHKIATIHYRNVLRLYYLKRRRLI